ncbi:MAG: endopeptidase La [Pseudomonadota bacterium]
MKSSRFVGTFPVVVPILPLRDMVVFPNVLIPLFLKGSRVVKLAESVVEGDNLVGLFYQRVRNRIGLMGDEISTVGTLARIQQVVRLEGGGVKAIVDGLCRVRLFRQIQTEPYMTGEVDFMEERCEPQELSYTLVQSMGNLFRISLCLSRSTSEYSVSMIDKADDPGKLADLISVYLPLKASMKQELLETEDTLERLKKVSYYLNTEVRAHQPRLQAQNEALQATAAAKRQREIGLRSRLGSVQRDLAQEEDPYMAEIREFQQKVRESGMPDAAVEVAVRELQRLERIPPHSPEYTVSRTYVEVLTSLPWNVNAEDDLDINRAQQVLDEDHYDLTKVKDRILEFLAVHSLKPTNKGPILCFVGPPGVGKTSLGRSIARALGRKFVRMSLGGMRDEAEIRGHRRTYIGAMPGRIIQEIKRCGTRNPVFMLDELDKVGQDFRGDPASALLEVLDPEQNSAFVDHYLDIPFDLSGVMFIATANLLDPIPAPLRDRMEMIHIPGYTDEEKEKIAELFLIEKALDENGLKEFPVSFSPDAVSFLIRSFTREAGVRNLEREIHSVCRKIAREVTQGLLPRDEVTPATVEELLGPPKYFFDLAEEEDRVGISTGLAWTATGGDIIFIEVTGFRGGKSLTLTGSLGDVMQESAKAALSYLRSTCLEHGIEDDAMADLDLHIHVPSGGIPKDGPSAGITIAVALASFLTGIPVRRDVAMTGEVTLRGRVLRVGGVKEKVLAARRAGVREIILPEKNRSSLKDLPEHVLDEMAIHLVSNVGEAIRIALMPDSKVDGIQRLSPGPILPGFAEETAEYVVNSQAQASECGKAETCLLECRTER